MRHWAPGLLVALATVLPPALASSAQVTWHAPEDGGTPRDPARIEPQGGRAFRIRAVAEEGPAGPLKHAVSRLDLVCRNAGREAVDVTVHADLSGDGRRPLRDEVPWGDMPRRDYLYVQPPGRPWRRVDGRVSGWVVSVTFTAAPGETRVGLSPWYTYADLLRFVASLPEDDPKLRKARLEDSDGGRQHWELTVTDPAIPAGRKKRVFAHAREHAYETFSSFAMEGLARWLLSGDADAVAARQRYVFTLHPMTNVDGVAQGYEYRGGYDHPNPRGTRTGRLTFAAMDRLKPDFVIAWHNWVAPRDLDVVFYTDAEAGRPSRRAWDLFTQRFPSPRGAGHRWMDDANPLTKNWSGRRLDEVNVHQYAMKRYGSAVWGWEMPWYGRGDDGDDPTEHARRAGADFGRAFVATIDRLAAGDAALPRAEAAPVTAVPRWEVHEFELHGRSHVANPFRDAALVGEFTSPSGRRLSVEGFHDGGDAWRLRFAPDEEGEWRYLLRGEGAELWQRGRLRCVAPRGPGPIRIHPQNPCAFARADGSPFFPMGDTCYGLHDDLPITPELRREYLATRRRQRFNFVRMSVGHSEARAAADPARYWAWGGTPAAPDLDRLNPAFFRSLDEVFGELREHGMNVELILLNFYRRPFTDPKLWTPARERLWLRHVIARYAAYDHVFLWTLANEYETRPDGKYRLDRPADVAWAKATARLVKQLDPYRHLVTVHPVISSSATGASPRDPFEAPWRIGGFFGDADAIDVLSQQTSAAYPTRWDEALQCWTGDVPGVSASVAADRVFGKPVLNTEFGYERLRGDPTSRRQVHHTDKVRRSAWRIACAGGYFAAGFHGTLGHSDAWNRIDPPNRYAFVVKDEGAAGQLGLLHDLFSTLPFWRMEPFAGVKGDAAAVALAEPGKVYVAYLPQGGAVTLDLSAATGAMTGRWFNPRDGKSGEPFEVAAGAPSSFRAPDDQDWVLHVSARAK